jgi:hypothetical protein
LRAAVLHQALDPTGRRPQIATYSWDRLLIDPLPGPRNPSSFTRLQPVGDHNYRVTSGTTVRPPAGSTLPRLAAELQADLFLLDPRGGAHGLARQLSELARLLDQRTVTIVDVGGDILAHGDEPALRSPLADCLVLAATTALDNVQVLVTGWLMGRGKGHAVVHQTGIHGGLSPRIVGTMAAVAFIFGTIVLVADALTAS